jgi:hypothetical protein
VSRVARLDLPGGTRSLDTWVTLKGDANMREQSRNLFAGAREQLSHSTLLLAALFLISLAAGIFASLDGYLEYFKVIAGRPTMKLETASALFLLTGAAFLAMGMSVSAEAMAREKAADR